MLNSRVDQLPLNRTRTTGYTYDSFGNFKTITFLQGTAGAITTTYNYETAFQQLVSVVDPLQRTWRFIVNGNNGNRAAAIDPVGNTTSYGYDGRGQLISVADALGHVTTATYDGSDLVSITDPLSRTTTLGYDAVGRVIRVQSPMGHVTQVGYDQLNRVTQITDALNGNTALEYDPNGNLKTWQTHSFTRPLPPSTRSASATYRRTR